MTKTKYLFLCFILILSLGAKAQKELEFYVTPGLGYRQITPQTGFDKAYKDSLNSIDRTGKNWSAGISYILDIDRNTHLQMGVLYRRVGFTRVMEDLQFHQWVHPSIGRIEDLSQSVQKDAYFYYTYQYVSVPFVYQKFVAPKYGRSKNSVHFISGLSFDYKMEDNTRIFLKGFTVKGKSKYVIPNDYLGSDFNVYALIGGRFQFEIAPKTYFNLQPHLAYPILTTASNSEISMRAYQFNLQTGVSIQL